VTLQEAIERTLKANPQMAQVTGELRNSVAGQKAAHGEWLPTLSLNAGSTITAAGFSAVPSSSNTPTGPTNPTGASTPTTSSNVSSPVVLQGINGTPGVNAGVSAAWDVYTGGRRGADLRAADSTFHAAQSDLISAQASVTLTAETAFFEDLRQQELVNVARTQVEQAKEALLAAQRREKVGNATKSDVLRAELALNTAQQSVLQQETTHTSAAFALGRLIGADGAVHARSEGSFEPALLQSPDDTVIAEIGSNSPAVASAEANLASTKATVDAAHARWMPSIQLTTGYKWYNNGFSDASGNTYWTVGLGLSYPIFDGFIRDQNLEIARSADYIADTTLTDTRRQVRSQAESALGGVKMAQQRIALAQKAVDVAQEDLRVQQDRYAQGLATMLDLLTSQSGLATAKTNLVTAKFDYQLARAQLEALAGRKL
jgi:outer membrane protein TolC